MWGERLLVSVGESVCETAMKIEWDSRLTQPLLRECVIWTWQWCNGIFLVNYRDLVHCESERVISHSNKGLLCKLIALFRFNHCVSTPPVNNDPDSWMQPQFLCTEELSTMQSANHLAHTMLHQLSRWCPHEHVQMWIIMVHVEYPVIVGVKWKET